MAAVASPLPTLLTRFIACSGDRLARYAPRIAISSRPRIQVQRRVERRRRRIPDRVHEGGAGVAFDVAQAPGLTLVGPVLGSQGVRLLEVSERISGLAVKRQVGAEVKVRSREHVVELQHGQA